ncbi:hypothetical protein BTUL_0082g00500 [Botrytis tulipae]|uniref:Uncharacterized protein n=1 Tax=Botrytis tulipae TaxID=87230 RepID=A0A4Z1EK17_9HELO|nr:hypothetical protein BTUL_0082g00500 [Botrytis tulipae]
MGLEGSGTDKAPLATKLGPRLFSATMASRSVLEASTGCQGDNTRVLTLGSSVKRKAVTCCE